MRGKDQREEILNSPAPLHDKMLALACIHSVLEQEVCRKLIIHAKWLDADDDNVLEM